MEIKLDKELKLFTNNMHQLRPNIILHTNKDYYIKKILVCFLFPLLMISQTPCLDAVANASGLIGEFIPQCEDDGSYSPTQCWGSTGYCWCVDVNGVEIPGTSLGPGEGIPDCNEQQGTLNVLFIGNSYTSSNNLTNIISSIANLMGDELYVEKSLIGGATLQNHLNNNATTELIESGIWNHVVLQEQSQYPSFPLWQVEQDVFPYATQLNYLANQYNACNNTIFFMTWGRENGDYNNCENWPPVCTYEGMDDLIRERYLTMAEQNSASISPVGAVWRYIRDFNYEIDLYNSDGSHPSYLGSYAAAVCFYTTLFQKNPLEINWTYDLGVSEFNHEIIIQVVKDVVYDNLDEWSIQSNDIDSDGVCNNLDNCPESFNPDQEDLNNNNVGDLCEESSTILEELPKRRLAKVVDIFGRRTLNGCLQIRVYDDGSVKKVYTIN